MPYRPRRHGGLVALFVLLFVLALLAIAAYGAWALAIKPAVQRQAVMGLKQGIDAAVGSGVTRIKQGDVPAGEFTVTVAEINSYLAGNKRAYAPIDQVTVQSLENGRISAEISALGFKSQVETSVAASSGQLQVKGTSVDGPLGLLLAGSDVDRTLTSEINTLLAQQGLSVESVRVANGVLSVRMR